MRVITGIVLVSVVAFLAACGDAAEEEAVAPPRPLAPAELIKRAENAVVLVEAKFGDFEGTGTGFVIDTNDGLVMTAQHVVDGASRIRGYVNGKWYPMKQLAGGPCSGIDAALLEFVRKPEAIGQLPLGSSDQLENGDWVMALGFPAKLGTSGRPTLASTQGSVSNAALANLTPDPSIARLDKVVQTDAAINPGNSGGPLVNDKGQVVGMNDMTNTFQGGRIIQGQGYAIAIDPIKAALPAMEKSDPSASPGAGASLQPLGFVDLSTWLYLSDYGLNRSQARAGARWIKRKYDGLYVLSTKAGSPLDKAGFLSGDLITRIDGATMSSMTRYCDSVVSMSPGDTARVEGVWLDSASTFRGLLTPFLKKVKLAG